jgi:hypothetical protein
MDARTGPGDGAAGARHRTYDRLVPVSGPTKVEVMENASACAAA